MPESVLHQGLLRIREIGPYPMTSIDGIIKIQTVSR